MVSLLTDPYIGLQVNDFTLHTHNNKPIRLSSQIGDVGLLLGFSGDIWDLSSVRQVLWLHRQSYKLGLHGLGTVVVVPNQAHELHSFFLSIPREITFPLLADKNQATYTAFDMTQTSGFVLVNPDMCIVRRWLTHDNVPSVRDVIATAERNWNMG